MLNVITAVNNQLLCIFHFEISKLGMQNNWLYCTLTKVQKCTHNVAEEKFTRGAPDDVILANRHSMVGFATQSFRTKQSMKNFIQNIISQKIRLRGRKRFTHIINQLSLIRIIVCGPIEIEHQSKNENSNCATLINTTKITTFGTDFG